MSPTPNREHRQQHGQIYRAMCGLTISQQPACARHYEWQHGAVYRHFSPAVWHLDPALESGPCFPFLQPSQVIYHQNQRRYRQPASPASHRKATPQAVSLHPEHQKGQLSILANLQALRAFPVEHQSGINALDAL